MAHNLARLLGGDTKQHIALLELRKMTRDDSDVRLLTDIIARAYTIVRALGLDPKDITAEEIYQALQGVAPYVEQLAPFKASEWVVMDFDGQIISFNPIDIVENYHHAVPFGSQRVTHGRRRLGQEIARRYSDHPATHAPAVERVVCDGGICWLERDEQEAKRKLAENFAHKISKKTPPVEKAEPILSPIKNSSQTKDVSKNFKKQRAEKKSAPKKSKKFHKAKSSKKLRSA